jgi:hypothetical protein
MLWAIRRAKAHMSHLEIRRLEPREESRQLGRRIVDETELSAKAGWPRTGDGRTTVQAEFFNNFVDDGAPLNDLPLSIKKATRLAKQERQAMN